VFNSAPLFQVELVEIGGRRSRIIHAEITPRFPFVRKPREADVCTSNRRPNAGAGS